MDNREATKLVVRCLTEVGAGYIVKELIKGNATTPRRIDKKIAYVLGAFAIAGFIASKAGNYVDRTIDDIFDAYDKVVKELKK